MSDASIYFTLDPNCAKSSAHQVGVFCHDCRALQMPWGDQLPRVPIDELARSDVGLAGSILAGVNLQDRRDVSILSLLVYLDVNENPLDTSESFKAALRKANVDAHQEVITAAREIGILINNLLFIVKACQSCDSDQVIEVLDWYIILAKLFEAPHLSTTEQNTRLIEHFGISRLISKQPVPPVGRAGHSSGIGKDGGVISEVNAESDDSNDGQDDDENIDKGGERKLMEAMPHRPKNNCKDSEVAWTMYPNTDTSIAKLSQPDVTKFFFVRYRDVDGVRQYDRWEYEHWETFDWECPADIHILNKARNRWSKETTGEKKKFHMPWTVDEKDHLEKLIRAQLGAPDFSQLDMERVTNDLNAHFKNVVFPAGTKIAKHMERNRKKEIVPSRTKAPLALVEARTISAVRSVAAVTSQLQRYADLPQLTGPKKRKGKGALEEERLSEETGGEEAGENGEGPSGERSGSNRREYE